MGLEEVMTVITKDVYVEVNGGAAKAAAKQKQLAKDTEKTKKMTEGMAVALKSGLEKHGDFDFNKNLNFELADANARGLSKTIDGMATALNSGLEKHGGFDFNEQLNMDFADASMKGAGTTAKNMSSDLKVLTKDYDDLISKGSIWDIIDFSGPEAKENIKGFDELMAGLDEGKASMRDINFEFLGVMFFGQNVAKVFGDMLKPALDLFGVMDLWSLTLKLTFLPVIEQIFPWLLKMMNAFMDMPDGIKLVIGAIAVLGFVFGSIVGTIGTLVLGIQSVAIAFTGAIVPLTTFTTVATTALGVIGTLAGIGLIGIGITILVGSMTEDGLQIWNDIAAGVALGLGLGLVTGAGILGTIGLTGAAISFAVGIDLLFDSLKRPGMQIMQDLIAGFLIGAGLAAAAGLIAGSMTVALGVATITIPLAIVFAVGLDWMFANAKNNPEQIFQDIAGSGVSFGGSGFTPDLPAGLQSEIGSNFDNYNISTQPGYGANTSTVINNDYNITTNDDQGILRLFADMERNIMAQINSSTDK